MCPLANEVSDDERNRGIEEDKEGNGEQTDAQKVSSCLEFRCCKHDVNQWPWEPWNDLRPGGEGDAREIMLWVSVIFEYNAGER